MMMVLMIMMGLMMIMILMMVIMMMVALMMAQIKHDLILRQNEKISKVIKSFHSLILSSLKRYFHKF